MSDSSNNQRPSIAAFLFMPQFRLSFQHTSFVIPIFIRTVAAMFEQAGLLPPNHPAARYGTEGIRKYKFRELIGEAWYTLRSTRATPYQWSLFASIVLMISMVILSFIIAALSISGMFVGKASAQIFDSVSGGDTSSATVPAAPDPLAMFDRSVAGGFALGQPHGDWGIMILDKMLRQGAEMRGGLMQNAFGSLMQIYNTGILVIAGIMIFWLILFVVTDTAKTGQIGGQRHNMVWAPIRIIFALGLLIPLGSSGFSSGQYMVMKLAEWGSNFGSRGWVTYIETITNNQALLAKFGTQNPTDLMSQYVQMFICRVAYNGAANQAGALTGDQVVLTVRRINTQAMPGRSQFFFTNRTYKNLCGAVDFPAMNTEAIQKLLAGSPTDKVIGEYQNSLALAYFNLFFAGSPMANAPLQNDDGILAPQARRFACAFTSQFIYPSATDPNNPLLAGDVDGGLIGGIAGLFGLSTPKACDDGEVGAGVCGAGAPGSGQLPDTVCIEDLIRLYTGSIEAVHKAGDAMLQAALDDNGAILDEIKKQGWPGMGVWYHKIEQMNDVVGKLRKPGIAFLKGDLSPVAGTGIGSKVYEVLAQYRPWWNVHVAIEASSTAGPATDALTSDWASSFPPLSTNTGTADLQGKVEGAQDADKEAFAGEILELAGGDVAARFFLDMVDPKDSDVYPLAKLAKLGTTLQSIALIIYGGIAILEIGSSVLAGAATGTAEIASRSLLGAVGVGSVGLPFALGFQEGVRAFISGPVTAVLTTFAGICFAAALVLVYYIPMLPFVRVAYSVLTWMISVFEAVVMVPIAALAHLNTEGEGLAGGARSAWILWLNVLLRPILTVIGFVGALLVFNTFVIWIHESFGAFMNKGIRGSGNAIFAHLAFSIIYVFIVYTAANSCFKLLDIIPSAMFKWIGGGQADTSFDDDGAKGIMRDAGQFSNAINMKGGGKKGASSSRVQADGAIRGEEAQADQRAFHGLKERPPR